jgi:hypothetical protein
LAQSIQSHRPKAFDALFAGKIGDAGSVDDYTSEILIVISIDENNLFCAVNTSSKEGKHLFL